LAHGIQKRTGVGFIRGRRLWVSTVMGRMVGVAGVHGAIVTDVRR